MILLQPINTEHALYLFIEKLLHSAFPSDERRDDEQQRAYTDNNKQFHCLLIRSLEIPVGLLTYWDFESFAYIEHFAIDSRLRNGGYGSKALDAFKRLISKPIVLEAEEPTDEITCRRICFYQRQGFVMQEVDYLQPPYRPEDEWFPLKLMTYGPIKIEQAYSSVKDTIYREVYQA